MAGLTPDQWRALSPHLEAALGMTDEERSNWLSGLRTRNPTLADEMEDLLGHHRALDSEGFLQKRSIGLPSESGLTGQTLGAYKLIAQIGQGGMSSVWLAERNDARFQRKVAVKFLKIALIGRAEEERFKREGNILGRLSHPNIAELIDAGVSRAGQPYLVLEHIEGDQIDSYCDQRRLGIEARIRLFLDVLLAIAHAHANMIVHRDLKPPNILVRNDGQVKLLDFGIAKLLEDGEHSGNTPLTLDSGRAMTPEYAAPEQLMNAVATRATDVYALGVLLYVLLTGYHPAGAGPHTHPNLAKAIVDVEPARLSDIVAPTKSTVGMANRNADCRATTVDRLSRTLRGDLDTIVAKTLKKDPQERYVSVTALADDLRRYLRHEPISARPDLIAYRAAKFIRRRRRSVMAALLGTLILTGATALTWTLSQSSDAPPHFKQARLTANLRDLPVLNAAISPDGKHLAYGDQQGIHLQLVETGEVQSLPTFPGIQPGNAYWVVSSWFPDSARFIASVAVPGRPVGVWLVPIRGGMPEKFADVDDMVGEAKASPGGSHIAFARGKSELGAREIWLMGPHGESPHRVITAEDRSAFGVIAWSPAGNRIAYSYARQRGDQPEISIQSCDLNGANQTTILRDDALFGLAWLAHGRFLYSRSTQRGSARAGDLWELSVDDRKGTPYGSSRRLTDWSGFSIHSFSASADGKRLAFLRSTHHASVLVGDLSANGNRLVNTQWLTSDDYINIALDWTPDSRAVFFSTQRAATRQIYWKGLYAESTAQLFSSRPGTNFYMARPSPDGAWVVLEGEPAGSNQMALYRVGLTGGTPQMMFPLEGLTQYFCTNKAAGFCVLGRPDPGKHELAISSFDPISADRRELLRIPLEPGTTASVGEDYFWQISPDGKWIGIGKRHQNVIHLTPLGEDPARTITVNGYSDLTDLHWAADSRSLFLSSRGPGGATLLHVDLVGNAQPIWQESQTSSFWGLPSPDARHLAISGESRETSVWMIGNL